MQLVGHWNIHEGKGLYQGGISHLPRLQTTHNTKHHQHHTVAPPLTQLKTGELRDVSYIDRGERRETIAVSEMRSLIGGGECRE